MFRFAVPVRSCRPRISNYQVRGLIGNIVADDGYVAYVSSRCVRHSNSCSPTARATGGGNALPTCRYAAVLPPEICQVSGNPCNLATIRTVNRGIPAKSGAGASSAIPRPSTPSCAQACLARVGPKSGPPCLSDPPTIVGAISFASLRHSAAPRQPRTAIRSCKTSPTVGDLMNFGSGQLKPSGTSFRIATNNKRAAAVARRNRTHSTTAGGSDIPADSPNRK